MTLTYVSDEATPSYVALSTDIVDGKIEGAGLVGRLVFTTDDGKWYVIGDDLVLAPYALPITLSGDVNVGAVNQGSASLTQSWLTSVTNTVGLTDTELRATPVPVSGSVSTGGLTDTELRATPVPVSGTVETGALTNTELRATPVPISGTVATSNGLTDTQIRATPLPVSGSVDVNPADISVVCPTNSSSIPLGANASFNGTYQELTKYSNLSINVISDVDSALDGFVVHWSIDGVTDTDVDTFTITANHGKQYTFGVTTKYFKVTYLNGATPQGNFELQTIKHTGSPKPSSHRVDDQIVADDDAELTKSVITGKAPDNTYRNVNTSMDGTLMVGIDDMQADAGGRVRVSQIQTLGDYKIIGFDRALMWESAGTGTGNWSSNKFLMSVTSGQYFIRQTRKFHPYFSGKSQAVEETFYGFSPQANVTKRVGYYSSNAVAPYQSDFDGFWLESGAGTITLKSSRFGTSTLSIPITSWSGYSNLAEYKTLSTWNNFTVVLFDFLWLGGAILRMWVKTSNGWVLAHAFNYSGTAPDVFILTPNQPLRYEIVSTTGSGSFTYVCAQVGTEGSLNESGSSRFVDTSSTLITLATIGTSYPVKAIRKASGFRDVPILVELLDGMVGSNNDLARWTLRINPTLSAPLTYAAVANSAAEEASGNGVITVTAGTGTIIAGGSLKSGAGLPQAQLTLNYLAWLGGSIGNTMDTCVLCVTPITGNITVYGGIGYKEY